jgi:hypothetical protein
MAVKAGVDHILLKADDESRSQCFFGLPARGSSPARLP